jgi:hypothetical protein
MLSTRLPSPSSLHRHGNGRFESLTIARPAREIYGAWRDLERRQGG